MRPASNPVTKSAPRRHREPPGTVQEHPVESGSPVASLAALVASAPSVVAWITDPTAPGTVVPGCSEFVVPLIASDPGVAVPVLRCSRRPVAQRNRGNYRSRPASLSDGCA